MKKAVIIFLGLAIASVATPSQSDTESLFFVTERDFKRVWKHWSSERHKDNSAWIDRLESEFSKEDSAPNSRDLEQSAVSAVMQDPRYSYDPLLSASDMQPHCRNYVCKIVIPEGVRVTTHSSAPRMEPGSVLDTYFRIFYGHGFGHHIVRHNTLTDKRIHYLLGNGYE